ncbi:hypothetical protein M1555_01105 [Patescibacteria group bacterium]|nr:hypothetical protein [Patescibacteria group bacterium]
MVDIKKPTDVANDIAKAQKVYESLGEEFVKANNGKFISVEPTSGEHFVGNTREEAVKLANAKYKGKVVFTRRIGTLEKVALHSSLTLGGNVYASLF